MIRTTMFSVLSGFIGLSFCATQQTMAANPAVQLTQKVHTRTAEQRKYDRILLETYAPTYFQNVNLLGTYQDRAGRTFEIMDPADALVDPDFDGDQNHANNGSSIQKRVKDNAGFERAAFDLMARVPAMQIETESHFYQLHMPYHAFDRKSEHTSDSEIAFVVIRKNADDVFGSLDYVVLNFHGYPKVYAPDEKLEKEIRAQFAKLMKSGTLWFGNDRMNVEHVAIGDRFARDHHDTGRPEFRLDPKSKKPRGMNVFSCAGSHGLCKANKELWADGKGNGPIYFCAPNGTEGKTFCFPMPPLEKRFIPFSILDFGELIQKQYPLVYEGEKLAPAEGSMTQEARAKLYEGGLLDTVVTVSNGKVRLRGDLPGSFTKGDSGKRDFKAHCALPFNCRFKTPNLRAGMPHLMDQTLRPNDKSISDVYIYNPVIEYVEAI